MEQLITPQTTHYYLCRICNYQFDKQQNVGENIRLYRIRAGLTIKELSKRIHRKHQLIIKPGSIRNYEKSTEKIPAVALNSIAAITRIYIREFYEPAHPTILLEAFSLIRYRASRDKLFHLAWKLSK